MGIGNLIVICALKLSPYHNKKRCSLKIRLRAVDTSIIFSCAASITTGFHVTRILFFDKNIISVSFMENL